MKKLTSIPFFFYHSVTPLYKGFDGISPAGFQRQMLFLKNHGYHTLFLDDIASFLKGEREIPERAVAISFDDGYLDNWLFAYPILKRYKMRATIFISTSYVENEPHLLRQIGQGTDNEATVSIKELAEHRLSWPELKTMERDGLIDVQSHMHTHSNRIREIVRKNNLNSEERVWLKTELVKSKELIGDRLKKSCNYICWPWGLYNRTFIALAEECGYKGAITSKRGANSLGSNLMEIKRFYIRPKWGGGRIWFSHRLKIYSNTILASIYALSVSIVSTPLRKMLGMRF